MPPKLYPVDINNIADLRVLYGMLNRRLSEPETNISHSKLPLWDDHVTYVRRKPHGRNNFLIINDDLVAGHCYLSFSNEIGVYLYPESRRKGLGQWAIQEMVKIGERKGGPIYANINPKNAASLRLFQALGFKERYRTKKQIVLEKSTPGTLPAPGVSPDVPSGKPNIND